VRTTAAVLLVLLGACGADAAGPAATPKDAFAKAAAEMRKKLGAGFLIERSGVFVIAGDLPRAPLARFRRRTIDDCARALWKGFFDKKPDYPIKVYLFRNKASYEKWVEKLAGFKPHTPYGFYMPSSKTLMMNIATGGGTLVHEMTHALTDPDFPECPTWLFEGLGSLFEQCYVDRAGRILGLVNWRLPVLRKGGFIALKKLIQTSDEEFRGKKESLHYANARYLCLYLQERRLLRTLYKTFREAHKAGKDKTGWESFKKVIKEDPGVFEKKWHAWVKTLRWPTGR